MCVCVCVCGVCVVCVCVYVCVCVCVCVCVTHELFIMSLNVIYFLIYSEPMVKDWIVLKNFKVIPVHTAEDIGGK